MGGSVRRNFRRNFFFLFSRCEIRGAILKSVEAGHPSPFTLAYYTICRVLFLLLAKEGFARSRCKPERLPFHEVRHQLWTTVVFVAAKRKVTAT